MTLTPTTLTRHELTGLPVRVADASNPDAVGIAGRVVSETTNTIVVGGARLFAAAGSSSAEGDEAVTADRTAATGGSATASVESRQQATTDETAGERDDANGENASERRGAGERDDTDGENASERRGAGERDDADGENASERRGAGERDEQTDDRRAAGDECCERRVPKRGTTFEFAVPTDEAASRRLLGSTFELPWETAGTGPTRPAGQSGGCESVGYLTVDGARLVARPARRTERAGEKLWQLD